MAVSVQDWVGSSDVSGWDIALAIVVLVAAWVLSRVAAAAARRAVSHLDSASDNARALVARMSKYFVLVLGFGVAISILGAPIQPVLAAAVIVAVVVALALRGVADNFGAGIVLQSRKPIQIGDFVAALGFEGIVVELNGRSVVLDLLDGRQVHLPNGELLANPLVNKSIGGTVRSQINVRAEWDGDPGELLHVLSRVTSQVPGVVASPGPQVVLEAVEPSRLRMAVGVWHQPSEGPTVASEAVQAIADALRSRSVRAAVESSAPPPPVPPPGPI